MENPKNTTNVHTDPDSKGKNLKASGALSKATILTPLELNNIRLDVRHTVLTPDYLDKLATKS